MKLRKANVRKTQIDGNERKLCLPAGLCNMAAEPSILRAFDVAGAQWKTLRRKMATTQQN